MSLPCSMWRPDVGVIEKMRTKVDTNHSSRYVLPFLEDYKRYTVSDNR